MTNTTTPSHKGIVYGIGMSGQALATMLTFIRCFRMDDRYTWEVNNTYNHLQKCVNEHVFTFEDGAVIKIIVPAMMGED